METIKQEPISQTSIVPHTPIPKIQKKTYILVIGEDRAIAPWMKTHLTCDKTPLVNKAQSWDITTQIALAIEHVRNLCSTSALEFAMVFISGENDH